MHPFLVRVGFDGSLDVGNYVDAQLVHWDSLLSQEDTMIKGSKTLFDKTVAVELEMKSRSLWISFLLSFHSHQLEALAVSGIPI